MKEFDEVIGEHYVNKLSIHIANVMTDALAQILKALQPLDVEGQVENMTADHIAKMLELNRLSDAHIKNKVHKKKGKEAEEQYRLNPTAANNFKKAIKIAGSAYQLAKLCGVNTARIYEITRGRYRRVPVKLAIKIQAATQDQVKAWHLNDDLQHLKVNNLEELKKQKYLKQNIDT